MFFTTVGIIALTVLGLALIRYAYYRFDMWMAVDGWLPSLIIPFVIFIAGVAVLYLTFSYAPIHITVG